MKHTALLLGVSLAIMLAGYAAAETVLPGLAQPVLVVVEQVVPADITLTIPQDDGATITVTAPISVGVNLQITIDGANVLAVVQAAEAEPPTEPAALSETVDGITVEVTGLEVTPIADVDADDPKTAERLRAYADFDPAAAGVLSVRVTNGTDEPANVVPIQHAALVVGSDQIDLSRYYMLITGDVDGDYYPGVTKEGSVTFAVPASVLDAVSDGAPVSYFIDTNAGEWSFEIQPTLPD